MYHPTFIVNSKLLQNKYIILEISLKKRFTVKVIAFLSLDRFLDESLDLGCVNTVGYMYVYNYELI